ncbi:MAG TPA: alpha/beta hydrolase [Segeticoccus sp.]|uniref:alpha/beta hydrolase n=1 Tax=Segeticoccus sp. TaxID=2706531 RepID=UPI002D80CC36|nr:lysophospholipase [Segeticoccus sp.]HET8598920.1 alpha/beta hydrolase [Segeticoccus sp.]
MTPGTDIELTGHAGKLHALRWLPTGDPTYVALLCHGYGEHIGRYEWVASRLAADGAVVYGLDHVGHGQSEGDRVLIGDFEPVVDDVHGLEQCARSEHPGLPVVLIGHSMGGMIAARYAQRYGESLACAVLSGPVIGRWDAVTQLLAADEIPDTPIDPATLSRDPSVGDAYVADPLVWHGPFKRPTLEAMNACLATITKAGPVESTPVLWLHGAEDPLVPYDGSAQGWQTLAGQRSEAKSYPGARHEIFNETNKEQVLGDVLTFVHAHLSGRSHP